MAYRQPANQFSFAGLKIVLLFDRHHLPAGVKVETVDTINATIERLHARKISSVTYESDTISGWNRSWATIYLQTHIRRSLSLIFGGLAELRAGRPIITALCARALLEDAAAIWNFVEKLDKLIDEGDEDATEDFLFSRALSTKLPRLLEERGAEFLAVNILTLVDRMTKLNPGYRATYDDLSEVVHPNSLGVVQHFADFNRGVATFDDGENMSSIALGALIEATYMLAADEPAISAIEEKLKRVGHHT